MAQRSSRYALSFALKMIVILLLGLSATSAPAGASAGFLFVSPSGSGNACTQDQPCSLATALSLVPGGYTIYLAGGTYTGTGEGVVLLTKTITLRGGWNGAGGSTVVVDAAAYPTTLDGQGFELCIYIDNNSSPTIEGLILTGGYHERGAGIHVRSGDPTISGNTITGNSATQQGGGIYVHSGNATVSNNTITENSAGDYGGAISVRSGDLTISGNTITHNTVRYGGGGVSMGTATVRMEGNTIAYNQASYGGAMQVATTYLWLAGNTIVHNEATSAVVAGGDGVQVIAENNVLARNGGTAFEISVGQGILTHNTVAANQRGVLLQYGAVLTATNNILADHTAVSISVGGGGSRVAVADHNLFWGNASDPVAGTNTVLGDPHFVNAFGGDYHLGLGSAAVDAGVDADVTTDIDGDVRPLGAGFDIGADEWVAPVTYLYLPLLAGTGA